MTELTPLHTALIKIFGLEEKPSDDEILPAPASVLIHEPMPSPKKLTGCYYCKYLSRNTHPRCAVNPLHVPGTDCADFERLTNN